jgi:hypothetical protein
MQFLFPLPLYLHHLCALACVSDSPWFDFYVLTERCTITYRYPPRDEAASSKEDPYVHSILGFCFPDLEHITEVTHYDPYGFQPSLTASTFCEGPLCLRYVFVTLYRVTFTFILTDMTGGRRFGYCRRVLPLGNVPRYPQAFCVLGYMYAIPCILLVTYADGV